MKILAMILVIYVTLGRLNLNHMSAELVYSELHDSINPALVQKRKKELPNDTTLVDYGLGMPILSVLTMYRWMRLLGYKYEVRKKCYYEDNHEKPENKRYRKKFTKTHLNVDFRMTRWLRFSIEDYKILCTDSPGFENELRSNGFRYHDLDPNDRSLPTTHFEFHMDDHRMFQENHSGLLAISVWWPSAKQLICFGQDECIFHQYVYSKKAWVTPERIRPLIPKDEGMGMMLSAFVSREYGFAYHDVTGPQQTSGLALSEEQRLIVNRFRHSRK